MFNRQDYECCRNLPIMRVGKSGFLRALLERARFPRRFGGLLVSSSYSSSAISELRALDTLYGRPNEALRAYKNFNAVFGENEGITRLSKIEPI